MMVILKGQEGPVRLYDPSQVLCRNLHQRTNFPSEVNLSFLEFEPIIYSISRWPRLLTYAVDFAEPRFVLRTLLGTLGSASEDGNMR